MKIHKSFDEKFEQKVWEEDFKPILSSMSCSQEEFSNTTGIPYTSNFIIAKIVQYKYSAGTNYTWSDTLQNYVEALNEICEKSLNSNSERGYQFSIRPTDARSFINLIQTHIDGKKQKVIDQL